MANRKLRNPNPSAELEYAMFLTRQSRQVEAQKLLEEILKFAPGFGPAYLERTICSRRAIWNPPWPKEESPSTGLART